MTPCGQLQPAQLRPAMVSQGRAEKLGASSPSLPTTPAQRPNSLPPPRPPTSVPGIPALTLGPRERRGRRGLRGSAQGPKGSHGRGLGQMQRWQERGPGPCHVTLQRCAPGHLLLSPAPGAGAVSEGGLAGKAGVAAGSAPRSAWQRLGQECLLDCGGVLGWGWGRVLGIHPPSHHPALLVRAPLLCSPGSTRMGPSMASGTHGCLPSPGSAVPDPVNAPELIQCSQQSCGQLSRLWLDGDTASPQRPGSQQKQTGGLSFVLACLLIHPLDPEQGADSVCSNFTG